MEKDNKETESQHAQQRKPQQHFPAHIEQDLVEWYRGNQFLYDKVHPEYKNAGKRKARLNEKAEEVTKDLGEEVTRESLETWFRSMRTSWGKIAQKKSGAGAKKRTPKEEWILNNFGFLKDFVHRRNSAKMSSGKVI
jgi:hypothetical protein